MSGPPSSDLTFDQTPPRRPSLEDFWDEEIQNNATRPPKPGMPSAEMFNQLTKLARALGGLSSVAGISVRFNAGTPIQDLFVDLRTEPADVQISDAGPGETDITWPVDSYPPPVLRPLVFINDDLDMLAPRAIPLASPPTGRTGYRVRTKDSTGALADCAFTLVWWG